MQVARYTIKNNYEISLNKVKKQVVMPLTINSDINTINFLSNNLDLLEKLAFEIKIVSRDSYVMYGVPYFICIKSIKYFIAELGSYVNKHGKNFASYLTLLISKYISEEYYLKLDIAEVEKLISQVVNIHSNVDNCHCFKKLDEQQLAKLLDT